MDSGAVVGGKYRLVRRVGKGGMGAVWAATHLGTGAPVAVKLLTAEAATSSELRQRLVREAGAAARVRHPNVVDFHEVGVTEEGEPFLVMELLQGQTLRQLIRDRGRLDNASALWIGCEIARALSAAHAAGIAHRDLKPSNVFLHREGEDVVVKVLDFGVSKFLAEEHATMTSTGQAIGSPAYMSPEQAKGDRIDHRTDLWSLGVLLFEMVAGTRPFHADSPVALLSQILFGHVARLRDVVPDVDPIIDAIVSRCLERRVDARYQQAVQVLEALEARRSALAEAEAAQRALLGEWVMAPAQQEQEAPTQASESASVTENPPSASQASASGSQTGATAQSSSTAHGMSASLPAQSASIRRPAPVVRPRVPLLALIVPGIAFFVLFVALLALLVRSRARSTERDVVGAEGPPSAALPAPKPPPAPPPTTAAPAGPDAAASQAPPPPPAPKPAPAPVAPKPSPALAPPSPPPVKPPPVKPPTVKPQPKTCKSPIVDSAGKVIGCLD